MEDRPVIYVNEILSSEDGEYGIATEPKEIANCIKWSFKIEDAEKLKTVAKASSNGATVCSHIWHFIIYARLDNNLTTGEIYYFDCKNETDIALDRCNEFLNGDARLNEEFMKHFLLVEEKYEEIDGIAKLAIVTASL